MGAPLPLLEAADGTTDAALRRLATAVLKYHVCKKAPGVATEAMECMGGNGYVEDGPLARLYRQAPLNAIWEGSGNVICLDVLRTLAVEPASAAALVDELAATRGADSRYDAHVVTDSLPSSARAPPPPSRGVRAASSSGWQSRCRRAPCSAPARRASRRSARRASRRWAPRTARRAPT